MKISNLTYYSLFLFFINFTTYSQVGIGTVSPDPSSVLHLYSDSNKGFIGTRVSLDNVSNSSIDAVNPNADGLMIYNTNNTTINGEGLGYYFWNANDGQWISMKKGTDYWSKNGNAGTDNSNFIGTTDNQSLSFKVNNTQIAHLETNGGIAIGIGASSTNADNIILGNSQNTNAKIGIGTSTPNAKLHVKESIRYEDGNESEGKILTSDDNGNARWEFPGRYRGVKIIKDSNTSTSSGSFSQNSPVYSNSYVFDISLYPSKSVFIFRKNDNVDSGGFQSSIQFGGIKGGTDGRMVTIMNSEKQFAFTFVVNDSGVDDSYRFDINQNLTMNSEGYHSATFIYDGDSNKWLLISKLEGDSR